MNDKSHLQRLSSYLIQINCDWQMPSSNSDLDTVFLNYPITLDYEIRENENDLHLFSVIIDASINYKKEMPGYIISAEALLSFRLPKVAMQDVVMRDKLVHYHAIEIAIAYLRKQIYQTTASFPLGAYELKVVDMDFLYQEKIAQRKKLSSGKTKSNTFSFTLSTE